MPNNNANKTTLSRRQVMGLAAAASVISLPLRVEALELAGKRIWRTQSEVEEMERFGFTSRVQRVVDAHAGLKPVQSNWKELACEWSFALGQQSEGLNTEIDRYPGKGQQVVLPHRTLPADTPFWYISSPISLEAGALSIRADDGAQLWIGGKRIIGDKSIFVVAGSVNSQVLTVRVLNKAMHGGLRSISYMDEEDFRCWSDAIEQETRANKAILKLKHFLNPSNNVLDAAEKWADHPTAQTLDAWEAAMRPYAFPVIAPSILEFADDEAEIAWQTDVPHKQVLTYRPSNGQDRQAQVFSSNGSFKAKLTGLKPRSVIEYQIEGCNPVRFRPLPDKLPFQFAVWSDAHVGKDRFRQTISQMVRQKPDFTISTGDGVDDASSFEKWRLFFEIGSPLFGTTPTYFVGGNHEYDECFENLKSPYYEALALRGSKPWYAWSVGNCRFVALDPNVQFPTGIDAGSEQHRWLLDELASSVNQAAKWRFILIHQPPYSQGWTGYEGDIPIRELLDPLIEKHKVHFVISGHTHDYERLTRSYGSHHCTFLIVGGAGGGLEDGPLSSQPVMDTVVHRHHFGLFTVEDSRISFQAIGSDAEPIDKFTRSE